MSATNLLSSDKGQSFLPPPAIFLSEATSDGEDTADDSNVNAKGPRLVRCEAVLTDVEYSSDEDEVMRKCVTPAALNCSSESQVVERILERDTQALNDELTDTENLNASDDDMFEVNSEENVNDVDVCNEEDGITTISDKVKTNSKNRSKFGNIHKKVDIIYPCSEPYVGDSCKRINYTDHSSDKDYLTPVNKLAKKKKRKGKLLLDSCLTDTEDVDVPSDVDEISRVAKKDFSFNLFPSEKEEQEYTNRIKHTSSLRGSEKFTLLEFLTDKLEESGVTDTDDLVYSEWEDMPEPIKDTEYEIDFSNEVSNKESIIHTSVERKLKKKRTSKITPNSADSDDDDDDDYDEFSRNYKQNQKAKSTDNLTSNHLSVNKAGHFKLVDEIASALTDTEDLNYSDGECSSSRPKCPTPEMAFIEDSTILQNESVKIMKALEVISDADPPTDCEEVLLSISPRKPSKKKSGHCSSAPVGEGHTDTEELLLSDGGHLRLSELSDSGGDSCSETDVEVCSNVGDMDELRYYAPSVTPDCVRNLDNTYISNIEGSEGYLKQIKGKKTKCLFAGPPIIGASSPTPLEDTDSEEIQTEDETAEEFTYNRACTPSNYFEKFHLEDQSSVVHEKNTRTFHTDGAESLHIKDPSYQQDPVTDSEEVPLLD